MRDNKKNLISLSTYRRKRKKSHSKTSKKVVSDESFLFTEQEESVKINKKPAQIYYMDNYKARKTKEREQIETDMAYQKAQNDGKILFFADYYKTKKQNTDKSSGSFESFQNENLISLEVYRQKKQERQSSVKHAVSYGAMVLTLLLSFSIFFQKENPILSSRKIASETPDKKGQKFELKRGLSSVFKAEDEEEGLNWSQKVKEIEFTKENFFNGEKPSSSN